MEQKGPERQFNRLRLLSDLYLASVGKNNLQSGTRDSVRQLLCR